MLPRGSIVSPMLPWSSWKMAVVLPSASVIVYFAWRGIGVGLGLGLGRPLSRPVRRQPALGIVGPLDARAVGEGDRGQGVRIGRGRAGRVGVGRLAELVGEGQQVLAAGVVGVLRRLAAGSVIELIRPCAL